MVVLHVFFFFMKYQIHYLPDKDAIHKEQICYADADPLPKPYQLQEAQIFMSPWLIQMYGSYW